MRICGKDIKQSIQSTTVQLQYFSCGKSCKNKNYGNQIPPPYCGSHTRTTSILCLLFFADFFRRLLHSLQFFSKHFLNARSSLLKSSHSPLGTITTGNTSVTDTFGSYLILHHAELSNEHLAHFCPVARAKVIDGIIH